MDEKAKSIEELAIAAVTANIRANVEDFMNRMTLKDAGKGKFDISTVEELGLDLLEKNRQACAAMYGGLLSGADREQTKKKGKTTVRGR